MFWFIRSSLWLDVTFLRVSRWSAQKKLWFIIIKYKEILLLLLKFKKYKLGESNVKLFGDKIYYDSPYGIAGLQSMLTRHQRMLQESVEGKINTLLDVGANVGFYSMMVKEINPEVEIYALEPIPQTYNALKNNLPNAKVFNLAASDIPEKLTMYFNEKESAFSSVVTGSSSKKPGKIVEVVAITLDDFCLKNNIQNISLLKIDTESFEAHVLRGAYNTLKRTKYLSIEISIENNQNYTFSEINSLLFSKDFNFQLINFRNYSDKGYGYIPVWDFLYENIF